MKIVKFVLAGTVVLTIAGSAALAQQALTGVLTKIDRIHGVVAIQRTQSGTVGANNSGGGEEFKVQDGVALDDVHAGDRVSYSVTEAGGIKTVTKLGRQ
jgi:Cu/Ag efflux protein CusF